MNTVETGPSAPAALLAAATRITLRTALTVVTATPLVTRWPWPYRAVEMFAGLRPKSPYTRRETVQLPNTTAELIHAPGVPMRTGRVVLYLHGGAFLVCGPNTHHALITRLSKAANAPVLAVNYRMIPHSLSDGISDCLEGYFYLRESYAANQIVLAGDSAGGYLAMSVAIRLAGFETPAALVLLSPLLQLDPKGKKEHPNADRDAMFTGPAFDTLTALLRRSNNGVLYEPIEHLCTIMEPDEFPPTLIHVSGDEVLLHDATLAAERLEELGVSVDVVIWPGQIHVFQIAATIIPEAKRSLDQLGRFIIEKTSEKVSLQRDAHRTATVG